jgi:hypothetical protein
MDEIGRTADGAIVVNRHNSHLHDDVRLIIPDALARVHTEGRVYIEAEVEFGRVVGKSICVSTGPDDKIVYAQRLKRNGLTRFVLERESEPTTKAMIVLKKMDSAKEYILITAFAGSKSELEPWDPRATSASLLFWQNKALVWGGESVLEATITTECPW